LMLALVLMLSPFRIGFYYNSNRILFNRKDGYILQTVAKGNEIQIKNVFIGLKILIKDYEKK